MSQLQSFSQRGHGRPQRRCSSQGSGVVSSFLKRFQEDVSGATAIEYALIGGMLSIAIIGAASSIGEQLVEIFTDVQNGFPA